MNKLIQTVTLGADPEVRIYNGDKKIVTFSGAVRRRFAKEGEDATDWFKYVAFGATAEFIAKYFVKGSKMLIDGEVQTNNYEKDGVKHYGCQIVINTVEFFGKKADGEVKSENKPKSAPDNDWDFDDSEF